MNGQQHALAHFHGLFRLNFRQTRNGVFFAALAMDSPTSAKRGYRTQTEAVKEAGSTRNTLYLWIRSGKVQHPQTKMSPTKWLWSDKDIERLKAFKAAHPWQGRDSR